MSRPRKPKSFLVAANVRGSAKLAALPSDAARLGFFYVVLGEAKAADVPGLFASRSHFREVSGRFARYLEDYLRVGILEAGKLCPRCAKRWGAIPRGGLVVHDWHEHQYDPAKVERDRRYDERRGGYGPEYPTETPTDSDGNTADIDPVSVGNPSPISRAHVRGAREERRTGNVVLEAEQDVNRENGRAPGPDAEATEEEEQWLNALSSR